MHEEDNGILWKYSVPDSGQTTITRSRRLVISSVVYVDFHWMPEGFFDENPTMDVPRRQAQSAPG